MWSSLPKIRTLIAVAAALSLLVAVACAAEEAEQAAPAAAAAKALPAIQPAAPAAAVAQVMPAAPQRAAPAAPAAPAMSPQAAEAAAAAGPAAAAGATVMRAPVAAGAAMAEDMGYTPFTARVYGPDEFPTRLYTGPRPTKFTENPKFAALVKAGQPCGDNYTYKDYTPPAACPALMDRLPVPDDILVLPALQEIGVYGGVARQLEPGNTRIFNAATPQAMFRNDYDSVTSLAFVAKSGVMSSDGRVFKIVMRQGMRWSDGKPVTMDDVTWVWEDLNYNKERYPKGYGEKDPVTGNPIQFAVVDDWTFTLTFDTPNFAFAEGKASGRPYIRGSGWWAHKPHNSQWLPKYNDPDEMQAKLDAFGVDDWVALVVKQGLTRAYRAPFVGPFYKPGNGELWGAGTDWEWFSHDKAIANPYFFAVDPHGQQLPYLEEIDAPIIENREALVFRVMNGEKDIPGNRGLMVTEIPLYHQNMEKGDYSISKGASITGNDSTIVTQSDFQGDDEWARLLRTKDFRIALSLSMDRDSINEVAFLGLAVPMNPIGHPNNIFYPGDEYRNLNCCPRDLAAAGALMEKMGYSKNADGMWNRQDGTGILEFHWSVGDWQADVGELAAAGWKAFGINITTDAAYSTLPPEQQHISAPTDDDKGHNPWWIYWWSWWPVYGGRGVLPCAGQFYYTGGEEGCKPTGPDPAYTDIYGNMAPAGTYPQDISGKLKRYQDLTKEGASLSNFDPRRIEIGAEFYKIGSEYQFHYGTVGFGPVSVGIWRNNLRNVPPCCSGRGMGEVAQQYFEDGIDNVNHPGNRSKKYKSFSFALQ